MTLDDISFNLGRHFLKKRARDHLYRIDGSPPIAARSLHLAETATNELIKWGSVPKFVGDRFRLMRDTKKQNRNVYLELGVAVGLGRHFVLVKEADAEVSSLAQGLDYYNIRSYSGLERELGNRLRRYLLNIARYRTSDLPAADPSATYVIAHDDHDMPPDFCLAVGLSP